MRKLLELFVILCLNLHLLKNELQKMRVRASKSSNYINESSGKLEELQQKSSELDKKIRDEDMKIEFRADFTSYGVSFGVISLLISDLLVFIFQLNLLNNLFINGLFCFVGMNMGHIVLIDKDLKKKIKVLEKLSIKIEIYLKSRKSYKSLIEERNMVHKKILMLESNRDKAMVELTSLNKGIGTLDFRLHCSEDRPYKVGNWATIVRNEKPLSSKKRKRARQKIQTQI